MCGIDPGELTPFQGGPVYWPVPGVETRLKPRAESPGAAKGRAAAGGFRSGVCGTTSRRPIVPI